MEKLLILNPGSTSTKIAVFQDETPLFTESIVHSPEELAPFDHVADQYEFRKELVVKTLERHGVALASLSGIVSRGGLLTPIEAGGYQGHEDMGWPPQKKAPKETRQCLLLFIRQHHHGCHILVPGADCRKHANCHDSRSGQGDYYIDKNPERAAPVNHGRLLVVSGNLAQKTREEKDGKGHACSRIQQGQRCPAVQKMKIPHHQKQLNQGRGVRNKQQRHIHPQNRLRARETIPHQAVGTGDGKKRQNRRGRQHNHNGIKDTDAQIGLCDGADIIPPHQMLRQFHGIPQKLRICFKRGIKVPNQRVDHDRR